MKRIFVSAVIAALIMSNATVHADDQSLLLNDSQVTQIRTNCVATQAIFQRLKSSDALTRVNLGREYEAIATKLMAPLNSRIAANKLDGSALVKTTASFNAKLDEFRAEYQQYKLTLDSAIQMNCANQPVAFYDTITIARTQRAVVHEHVRTLGGLAAQYGVQFEEFVTQQQGTTEMSNP